MPTGIGFHHSALVYGCSKKDEKMKYWIVFFNTILELKNSTPFKKEISFLSNIANKLQAMQFSQN